jgi:Bacterial protein of unknown function (DUF937)
MSGDILATIARALTPDQIASSAAQAEMDSASARKAAELGVPAILGALSQLAMGSRGAARLANALKQRPTEAGRLPPAAAPAPNAEDSLIGFLLGGESAAALASAIGRCVGASVGATHAFLDDVAATILSVLAEECRPRGDGKTVANLLKANRDLFASAIPPGLSALLKASAFFDRLGAPAATVPGVQAVTPTGAQAGAPAAVLLRPRHGRQGQAHWAWLLVLLGLIAGAAWYFFSAATSEPNGHTGDGVSTALSEHWDRLADRAVPRGEMAASPARLGGGIYSLAGEKDAGLTAPARPDRQLAMAVSSLGRYLGIGEDHLAVAIGWLRAWQQSSGSDLHRVTGLASEKERVLPTVLRSRQHLHFVSPQCKDAIARALPVVATEKPVASLVTQ